MTGREYVYAHADEVFKLAGACVHREIMPRLMLMPSYIRHDPSTDADDLISGAVCSILKNADYFDESRGSLGTFVFYCTRQYFKTRVLRSLQTEQRTPPKGSVASIDKPLQNFNETLGDYIPSEYDLEADYCKDERTKRIVKIIDEMTNERDRYVIKRILLGGVSQSKVGEELGIKGEACRQRKERALRMIRQKLKAEGLI